MYEELVKHLRETSEDFGELDSVSVMLLEAAEAIEARDKAAEEWEFLSESWQKACKRLESRMPRWIPVTDRLPEKKEETE